MDISIYSPEECERIANGASLRYVKDNKPGIIRKGCGKGFAYYYPDGSKITDEKVLQRVELLAIPPAYEKVWICPWANGHIQATARDSKNRKQYFYHPLWQEARQQQKFDSMLQFGRTLSSLREHINEQLSGPASLKKNQIICAILYLLDTACVRIGNPLYAEENKTYGLTTLRKKHLFFDSHAAILHFNGKNSKTWHVVLNNKKIIRILKKCEEIPGYELFKYRDENKVLNTIHSQDINYYLQNLTNHPFTAKDFRTWIASREIFCRLLELPNQEKISLSLKEVANLLGHTPSVCQKNYVFPEIITCWKNGNLQDWHNRNHKKLAELSSDQRFQLWLEDFFSQKKL